MTNKGSLRKIKIEIDVINNPMLRNWTTRAETPKELEPFLVGLSVEHTTPMNGVYTVVELTGPADLLNNFLNNALRDVDRKAITLLYDEGDRNLG